MGRPTFEPPWGDETLLTDRCRLFYSAVMSVDLAGGPPGWVDGTAWLTRERFAFRPAQEPSHFWAVTVLRSEVSNVALVEGDGEPRLRFDLRSLRGAIPCELEVDDPAAWADAWGQDAGPRDDHDARRRLHDALARHERNRGRYVGLLRELSFPMGDWHVELIDDMRDVCGARLATLGIPEKEALWSAAEAIARHAEARGEEHGRSEQIAQICAAVGSIDGRRFRRYAPLPDWPHGEPVWLWLSDDEDRQLRALNVLSAPT